VTVAPVPILFLFAGRQLAKVSMFIPVVFVGPLAVIDNLIVVPNVVVAIVGVIDPVVMMFASQAQCGTCQRGG